MYNKSNTSNTLELSFIIRSGESFEERTERTSMNYTRADVTAEVATFAEQGTFDDTSLRIGNGVQAFSFHRHGDEEGSIRETEKGFDVRVSLNVEDDFVSASVRNASTLESAFEILANVEFMKGGGWHNSEQ